MDRTNETMVVDGQAGAASEAGPKLEAVMHLMWDRIEALEAQKRSLQRMVIIGVAAVAAVAMAAAVASSSRTRADDVALRDHAGRVRARFAVDSQSDATTLQLIDAKGHPQAVLATGKTGPTLSFYDDGGNARLRMGLATDSPVVDVMDAKLGETTRIDLAQPPPTAVALRQAQDEPAGARPQRVVTYRSRGSSSPYARSRYPLCGPGTLGCYSRSRFGGAG